MATIYARLAYLLPVNFPPVFCAPRPRSVYVPISLIGERIRDARCVTIWLARCHPRRCPGDPDRDKVRVQSGYQGA